LKLQTPSGKKGLQNHILNLNRLKLETRPAKRGCKTCPAKVKGWTSVLSDGIAKPVRQKKKIFLAPDYQTPLNLEIWIILIIKKQK